MFYENTQFTHENTNNKNTTEIKYSNVWKLISEYQIYIYHRVMMGKSMKYN